jgi:ATP-dependent helicase HrpB
LREDLAPTALLLQSMDTDLSSLDWLDAPPAAAIEQAQELLRQLGATGSTAREMARSPLHPRLSRLLVEARRRGVAREGCALAALLSAGDRLPARAPHASRSDLLVLLEGEWSAYAARLFRQLGGTGARSTAGAAEREDALLLSVLTGFPDRVARRRQGAELQLASGAPAQQAPNSTVTGADLFVAVEAEDRRSESSRGTPGQRRRAQWLLDLFPHRLAKSHSEWNRSGERVEAATSLMFDQIAIETRRTVPDPEQAGIFLAHKAVEVDLARFADLDEIMAFQSRVRFASEHGPVTPLDADAVESALASLATGLKSFAELESAARAGGLLRALERQMPPQSRRLLDEVAPSSIRLPRGRQVPVHYELNQPPWIASRLQDFFGMRETPTVGRGAVPVVVRLLAPNQRPVQMTSDLAGFWQRLYPQVRKELSRRYPKHAWPEKPLG